MANRFDARVDLKTVEFLLDLPDEFSLVDINVENEFAILSIETELDIPSNVTLQYQSDDYGNIVLAGME